MFGLILLFSPIYLAVFLVAGYPGNYVVSGAYFFPVYQFILVLPIRYMFKTEFQESVDWYLPIIVNLMTEYRIVFYITSLDF